MHFNKKAKDFLRNKKFIYQLIKNIKDFFYHFQLKYFSGSNKDIFTDIYKKNKWRDSYSSSGTGSNLKQTQTIVNEMPKIFSKYQIKSILDIPCGDFYWMKELKFLEINYLGADIVPELVKMNKKNFSKNNIKFKVLDLSKDELPCADLIFCRDCLVHLSYEDIFKCLNNIKRSNCKYLMTTNGSKR